MRREGEGGIERGEGVVITQREREREREREKERERDVDELTRAVRYMHKESVGVVIEWCGT